MGEGDGESAKRNIHCFTFFPSPYFLQLLAPLVQISFSPQPSTTVKIKDSNYNFHQDNTEHSPAKITPALKAVEALGTDSQLVQLAHDRVLL